LIELWSWGILKKELLWLEVLIDSLKFFYRITNFLSALIDMILSIFPFIAINLIEKRNLVEWKFFEIIVYIDQLLKTISTSNSEYSFINPLKSVDNLLSSHEIFSFIHKIGRYIILLFASECIIYLKAVSVSVETYEFSELWAEKIESVTIVTVKLHREISDSS